MKQIAVLFDAIRNERFAIAVKSGDSVTYYGSDGQAREWADWANTSVRIKSAELPAGIIFGPYRGTSDVEIDLEIEKLGYGISTIRVQEVKSRSYKIITSIKVANSSKVPAICDTPIFNFPDNKYFSAINYKALAFRSSVKEASALYEARTNNYAYSDSKGQFMAKPNSLEEKTLRPRFEQAMSRSLERRLGKKVLTQQVMAPGRENTGMFHDFETKSADLDFKSLGQRIGGGTRAARRSARFASASFDPKAWDGDGDGIVQEGTPFQRPAVPGINDRSTGGIVDINAATTAWESFANQPERGSIRRSSSRQRMDQARVSQVERGMASRAERAKRKSRRSAVPGKDKVQETDGQWWSLLSDEQRSTVEENLRQRLSDLEGVAKTGSGYSRLKDWWEGFVEANGEIRDPKGNVVQKGVKDPDGKPWALDSKIRGAALSDLGTAIFDINEELNKIIGDIQKDTALTDDEKSKKIKAAESEKQKYQRLLDDIKTLIQMDKGGDYSLLEHLHPGTRQAAIGKVGSKQTGYKKVDGDIPKGISDPKILSTAHGRTGGAVIDPTKEKKQKRDPKFKKWVRRLSEENPERARRRALRRQRRAAGKRGLNVGGFTVERPDKDKVKRRIRKAKRQILKQKKRGDIEAIRRDIAKNKKSAVGIRKTREGVEVETAGYVSYDADGKVVLTKDGIAALMEAGRIYRREKKPKSSKQNKEATFMASLWDAIGYNGTPATVREDEVEMLTAAGWGVIHRGHGGEDFAEDWISDPSRFITGQGGEAAGPGDYWAVQGSSWSSYIEEGKATGTVAWLSPDSRVVKQSELRKHRNDNESLGKIVENARKILGGEGKTVDAEEFLAEVGSLLDPNGDLAKSEMGQIYGQIFDMMRSGEMTSSEAFDAFKMLKQISQDAYGNYHAPLLGYDVIEIDGDGPSDRRMLVMNRSAVAVLDRTVNRGEAVSIGKAA